ncbi:MAG: uncharacterized protein KVP18_000103 [Porospora cf. gigantea A]|uniref:uncharacterized protein n=1 Tax=Porospora cf. gigantea A TaxID=2853593 RepID=UPI00355A2F6F|nr:MAG: hypothetical protein KVP18_000103 [Porospora cf. gigantea A]
MRALSWFCVFLVDAATEKIADSIGAASTDAQSKRAPSRRKTPPERKRSRRIRIPAGFEADAPFLQALDKVGGLQTASDMRKVLSPGIADAFVCRCFCTSQDYSVDNSLAKRVPGSRVDLFDPVALPIRRLHADEDLRFWIRQQGIQMNLVRPNPTGLVTHITELSSGTVIDVPPDLTRSERQKLLEAVSDDDAIKAAMERVKRGDSDPQLLAEIQEFRARFKLSGDRMSQVLPSLRITMDNSKVKPEDAKTVWDASCRHQCAKLVFSVAPETWQLAFHSEWGYLKDFEDLFPGNSWISAERPLQGYGIRDPPKTLKGEARAEYMHDNRWKAQERASSYPLFEQALAYHPALGKVQWDLIEGQELAKGVQTCARVRQALLQEQSEARGALMTWSDISSGLRIYKDPSDVYPPSKRPLAMQFVMQLAAGIHVAPETILGPNWRDCIVPPPVLSPEKLRKAYVSSVKPRPTGRLPARDLEGKAIQAYLEGSGVNLTPPWPALSEERRKSKSAYAVPVDQTFRLQVTFHAEAGALKGMDAFTGNLSKVRLGYVEFLGFYITPLERQGLEKKMASEILQLWIGPALTDQWSSLEEVITEGGGPRKNLEPLLVNGRPLRYYDRVRDVDVTETQPWYPELRDAEGVKGGLVELQEPDHEVVLDVFMDKVRGLVRQKGSKKKKDNLTSTSSSVSKTPSKPRDKGVGRKKRKSVSSLDLEEDEDSISLLQQDRVHLSHVTLDLEVGMFIGAWNTRKRRLMAAHHQLFLIGRPQYLTVHFSSGTSRYLKVKSESRVLGVFGSGDDSLVRVTEASEGYFDRIQGTPLETLFKDLIGRRLGYTSVPEDRKRFEMSTCPLPPFDSSLLLVTPSEDQDTAYFRRRRGYEEKFGLSHAAVPRDIHMTASRLLGSALGRVPAGTRIQRRRGGVPLGQEALYTRKVHKGQLVTFVCGPNSSGSRMVLREEGEEGDAESASSE